jgi:hypothetical protein
LRDAFFSIIDCDKKECLNYEEWIGVFTKCIDPKDTALVDWFVEQYHRHTEISSEPNLKKSDFIEIISDNEVRFYKFLYFPNIDNQPIALYLVWISLFAACV